jgi:3D (Asp-Asp-Asp) domain-containing protein
MQMWVRLGVKTENVTMVDVHGVIREGRADLDEFRAAFARKKSDPRRTLAEAIADADVLTQTRRGIVAADPHVIPLGTRIRVHDAGPYSGEYVVEDTGAKVDGREIDIYMPSTREAREFGRRKVYVEILETERDER